MANKLDWEGVGAALKSMHKEKDLLLNEWDLRTIRNINTAKSLARAEFAKKSCEEKTPSQLSCHIPFPSSVATSSKKSASKEEKLMALMNDEALVAMRKSAIGFLSAQLLGVAKIKQNEQVLIDQENTRRKLHNVSLFMGQLEKLADRLTKCPDWGEF